MDSLECLWQKHNKTKGLKTHFVDWEYSPKFFEIFHFDQETNSFTGKLDTGEEVNFSGENDFWEVYEEHNEYLSPKIA